MKKWNVVWLGVFCLLLVVGLTVPVLGAQEVPTVTYDSVSWQNPMYPDAEPAPQEKPPVRNQVIYRESLQEAAVDLRNALESRQTSVVIGYQLPSYDKAQIREIYAMAIAHTGVPTQGDYIQWHNKTWKADIKYWTYPTYVKVEMTWTLTYLASADQEAELTTAVNDLLKQLNVYNATAYEKVCAIYDYMCANIKYDYDGLAADSALCHSAYSALIHGKAVCQGYATLFYRLALSLGLDARLISGTGNGGAHGWNIVRLNGKYYDLDATWDANYKQLSMPYKYFLRCDANFEDHTRDADYLTAEFQNAYPMSMTDYNPDVKPQVIPGDVDGSGVLNTDDAIYLLQYVLMPELFPVNIPVDFSSNGAVDTDDAIYLLQHVLMPELFPL